MSAPIIILGLIIVLAIAAWGNVVIRNMRGDIPDIRPSQLVPGTPNTAENDPDTTETTGGSGDPNAGDNNSNPNNQTDRNINDEPLVPLDVTTVSLSEGHSEIVSALEKIAVAFGSAAVSLALYDGDEGVFYTYEYGYADIESKRRVDSETRFRIASLSKLVTAICAMTLVDDDLLDLDTDLSTYFGYELRNPHFPNTPITARMLMQHNSSIFDSGAFEVSRENGTSEEVRYLLESGFPFRRNDPGTNFEFSDFGYAVLGALCERISGKSLDTLSREVVFFPLGIDAAFVPSNLREIDNIAALYDDSHEETRSVQKQLDVTQSDSLGYDLHLASGNLTISTADFAKITAMIAGGGEIAGVRILSAESANTMHTATIDGAGYKQGLAVRFSSEEAMDSGGIYWQIGSGYEAASQYVYILEPNRGVVVVVTGVAAKRFDNGMLDVCTELSMAAMDMFS